MDGIRINQNFCEVNKDCLTYLRYVGVVLSILVSDVFDTAMGLLSFRTTCSSVSRFRLPRPWLPRFACLSASFAIDGRSPLILTTSIPICPDILVMRCTSLVLHGVFSIGTLPSEY
ncbi:hypothetical protein C1H46_042332 [Malus baccata]|uniref:Uncharacterized protein n=1 Tax=Malus baccata TaxID=106549 RepID=A0A540KD29_MALBA|nr:hypothetical protein C1H46_042332 [Malus baccata]